MIRPWGKVQDQDHGKKFWYSKLAPDTGKKSQCIIIIFLIYTPEKNLNNLWKSYWFVQYFGSGTRVRGRQKSLLQKNNHHLTGLHQKACMCFHNVTCSIQLHKKYQLSWQFWHTTLCGTNPVTEKKSGSSIAWIGVGITEIACGAMMYVKKLNNWAKLRTSEVMVKHLSQKFLKNFPSFRLHAAFNQLMCMPAEPYLKANSNNI